MKKIETGLFILRKNGWKKDSSVLFVCANP